MKRERSVTLVEEQVGRFRLRYVVDPDSGCHVWLGARDPKGYGVIGTARDGAFKAHRVAYEAKRGPIGEGMKLDHLCRNRPCINADHLEEVTGTKNTRRGAKARLTMAAAREIRAARAEGEKIASLAERFDVAESTIDDVVAGRTWKE